MLKPESQDALPGTNVVLKAVFTGTPSLTIKWFKEEKEILTGGTCFIKKDASSSTLALHSVKPSHSGQYTCQVANDAGKVSCTAVLFVKGAFLILFASMHSSLSLCMSCRYCLTTFKYDVLLFLFRTSIICDQT